MTFGCRASEVLPRTSSGVVLLLARRLHVILFAVHEEGGSQRRRGQQHQQCRDSLQSPHCPDSGRSPVLLNIRLRHLIAATREMMKLMEQGRRTTEASPQLQCSGYCEARVS